MGLALTRKHRWKGALNRNSYVLLWAKPTREFLRVVALGPSCDGEKEFLVIDLAGQVHTPPAIKV